MEIKKKTNKYSVILNPKILKLGNAKKNTNKLKNLNFI